MSIRISRFTIAAATLSLLTAAGGGIALSQQGQLSGADRMFVMQAAKAGTEEVREGKMERTSSNAGAAKFAQRMITDHTKADAHLASLAKYVGASDALHRGVAEAAPPQHLSGAVYLHKEIGDHRQVIALFRKEAGSGSNPSLVNFAKQTLPVLQSHLHMAQSLAH